MKWIVCRKENLPERRQGACGISKKQANRIHLTPSCLWRQISLDLSPTARANAVCPSRLLCWVLTVIKTLSFIGPSAVNQPRRPEATMTDSGWKSRCLEWEAKRHTATQFGPGSALRIRAQTPSRSGSSGPWALVKNWKQLECGWESCVSAGACRVAPVTGPSGPRNPSEPTS